MKILKLLLRIAIFITAAVIIGYFIHTGCNV